MPFGIMVVDRNIIRLPAKNETMKKPEWVERIVNEVALLENKKPWKDNQIRFRKGKSYRWAGRTHYRWVGKYHGKKTKIAFSYISVSCGAREDMNKMVLLHELAHSYCRVRSGHNQKFWEKAWGYYNHFRAELDWEAVKRSEFAYKAKSKVVYDYMFPEAKPLPEYGQLTLDIPLTI